ncbi:MAG: tetratricopeptide repeat protein [Verrucomicrobiae bacterium]|nr:tetratricopeptide repeat protein [Verrucomicrobiae bacterium]
MNGEDIRPLYIRLGLVLLALCAFWPVRDAEFINFDDPTYVSENPCLRGGLNWENVKWAMGADMLFQTRNLDYWQPVTVLSRLVDVSLFGMNAPAQHLVNLLFHLINALLVFEVCRRIFPGGRDDPELMKKCGWVAAFFAIHPLHVESVAWVTERKDVLYGMFWFLSIWAYARYVACPGWRRYLMVLVLFALGLMSKPMMLTLPLILLLLDVWPLRRVAWGDGATRWGCLIFEKVPLALMSGLVFWITWSLHGRSFTHGDAWFLGGKMVLAYGVYLLKTVIPTGLCIWHPAWSPLPWEWVMVSLAALLGLGTWGWRMRNQCPALLFGLVWFALTLMPVIGLKEAAWAERFMYVPVMGILVSVFSLLSFMRIFRSWAPVFYGCALIGLSFLCYRQATYWKNSETLFKRVLTVSPDCCMAHDHLGGVYARQGRVDEAVLHLRQALALEPSAGEACNNLGIIMVGKGRREVALRYFFRASRLRPDKPKIFVNLGNVLDEIGRSDDAVAAYQHALQMEPRLAVAHANLASVLIRRGRVEEGLDHYRETIRLQPDDGIALGNLAWLLGTLPDARLRDGSTAQSLAQRAVDLSEGRSAHAWMALAAALAEQGDFSRARQSAASALTLARQAGDTGLAGRLEMQLKEYEAGRPWRQDPQTFSPQASSAK